MKLALKKYELHPEGLFPMTISRVLDDDLGFGPVFKIGLKSDVGEVMLICSQSYSGSSKFGGFVKAVLGSMPENVDTDMLIGKKLRAFVCHVEKDGKTYDRVERFLSATPSSDPFEEQ